jgi:hypothetical protein
MCEETNLQLYDKQQQGWYTAMIKELSCLQNKKQH